MSATLIRTVRPLWRRISTAVRCAYWRWGISIAQADIGDWRCEIAEAHRLGLSWLATDLYVEGKKLQIESHESVIAQLRGRIAEAEAS